MLSYRLLVHLQGSHSFSRTAEEFGLVVSTVSRKLEKLEVELGIKLLSKTTHGVELTNEGKELVKVVRDSLRKIDDVVNTIAHPDFKIREVIKITSFESFGHRVLTSVISDILKKKPEMNIDLDLSNKVYNFSDQAFDLYFRIGRLNDSNMICKKITGNELGIYAQKNFALKNPEDLEKVNCLTINSRCKPTRIKVKTVKKTYKLEVRGNFSSKGGLPMEKLLLAGSCVGILPRWMAGRNDELQRLFANSQIEVLGLNAPEIFAIYHPTLKLDPRIKFIINELKKSI